MLRADKKIDHAILAFCVGVVAIFLCWVFFYSIQAPISEDAITTCQPLVDFFNSHSWVEKYFALTRQQAEHHLLPSRLTALFSILLFGHLDFTFVYFVGAAFVIAFVWIVYRDQAQSNTAQAIDLLFYALLILNPAYRTGTFAIWGISNFASIVFPALAIVLMHRKSWLAFAGFQLFSFLSLNSQGNGALVPVMGVFYFWFDARGKDFTRLFIHLVISVAMLLVYLSRFETLGLQLLYQQFMGQPLASLLFYLSTVSAWIGQWVLVRDSILHNYIYTGVMISRYIGLFIILVGGYFFIKNIRQLKETYSIRLYLFLYVLGTIIGASWNRALIAAYLQHATDPLAQGFVLDSRFSFYAICLFILLYSLMVSVYRQRFIKGPAKAISGSSNRLRYLLPLVLGLLFCAARYVDAVPDMLLEKKQQLSCIQQWQAGGVAKPCLWHGDTAKAMKAAERQGWLVIGER